MSWDLSIPKLIRKSVVLEKKTCILKKLFMIFEFVEYGLASWTINDYSILSWQRSLSVVFNVFSSTVVFWEMRNWCQVSIPCFMYGLEVVQVKNAVGIQSWLLNIYIYQVRFGQVMSLLHLFVDVPCNNLMDAYCCDYFPNVVCFAQHV